MALDRRLPQVEALGDLGVRMAAADQDLAPWRRSPVRSGAGADPAPAPSPRLHQVGLLAGLAGLAWFLWQWNLLGWQYA